MVFQASNLSNKEDENANAKKHRIDHERRLTNLSRGLFVGIRPIKTKGTVISQNFMNESILDGPVERPVLRRAESTALLLNNENRDILDNNSSSGEQRRISSRKFS